MKYASVLLLGHNSNLNAFFLTAAGMGEDTLLLGCFPPNFIAHAGADGLTVLAREAAVLVQ